MMPEREEESVRDTFARVFADGRAYASAEIERQKLRAGVAVAGVRDAVIFAAMGFVLAFAAIIACFVGVIMALTPHLGAGWATALVVIAVLMVAAILLLLAKARIARVKRAIR